MRKRKGVDLDGREIRGGMGRTWGGVLGIRVCCMIKTYFQ